MKMFVTGGAGFIGSNFIRHVLANSAHTVVSFDSLTYASNPEPADVRGSSAYQFIRGDVRDSCAVESAMEGCDAVVHLAAETHVDTGIEDPLRFVSTNVMGTWTVVEAARKLGIKRFLQVSTDEVYGECPPASYSSESDLLRPGNPYSASKAAGDHYVLACVRTYGFPGLICRSSNNYGPFQHREKFIPMVILNALQDRPVGIYGDGLQEREWLYVEDHCEALLAVLERGSVGQIYNVGSCGPERNIDIARSIIQALGKPESLLQHVKDRPGHDRRYALDSTRIRSELGWMPRTSFADGIQATVTWFAEQLRTPGTASVEAR